jgi:DNA-binding transcriptional MerR regulator
MNIGELSRLSGLSVKTIRYYSDVGLVPEADRSVSNYRRYDHTSLARLEYVRTLRELGLDIATIRRVLDQGEDLTAVATAHAEALGAQIRILRLRRAALRAIARRDPTPEELDRMNRIAQATADERRRIVEQFFDAIFDGVPETPASTEFVARMRSVTADLPDDPTDAQVDAWIELAEMLRDERFQAKLRAMGQRSFGDGPKVMPNGPEAMRNAQILVDRVTAAMDAGITPSSAAAATVVDELVGPWATAVGRTDDEEFRRDLLAQLDEAHEPRAERYWQLLAIINGWPPIPASAHRWAWLADALRFEPR